MTKAGPRDRTQPAPVLTGADGYTARDSQSEASRLMPFMDHWNVSRPQVSLRDIIKEEKALQENMEKVTHMHIFCTNTINFFHHANTLNVRMLEI